MNEQTPRPGKRQVFAALGKAAFYLGIFLTWQVLVSVVYTVVIEYRLLLASPDLLNADMAELINTLMPMVAGEVMAKLIEISLISNLLTLVTIAVFFTVRRKNLRRELWLAPVPGRVLAWSTALAFCLYWLVTLAMSLLPQSALDSYTEASAGLEVAGVLPFISTALIAPLTEEIIFRGLVYTRMQRALSGRLAVFLSAVVFGACHGQMVWFVYAFFLGFIFASLTRSTRSILPSLLMHVVFNTTNEVLAFFPDWEPGLWFYVLILVLATAGTVLCTFRLRRAVAAAPVPFEMLPEQPFQDVPEQLRVAEAAPPPEVPTPVEPAPPARGGQAQWDPDSGMDHKFPANRM